MVKRRGQTRNVNNFALPHQQAITWSSPISYILAYDDDVNILAGSIHILKENTEALITATREIGLEVSAHKTKYMVMSRDQNAGRIQSVRIDNSTFEGGNV